MLPSLSLWIHCPPFDSLSPCLFSSHLGRSQNTSLFQLSSVLHTHLVPPHAAVFTLCARVLPTPPTLAHFSYLQLSISLSLLSLFFFICISPPTPPLPSLVFTDFHLSSPLFILCHSRYPPMNTVFLLPSASIPGSLSSSPSSASRLWISLTCLVRSVDFLPLEICMCVYAVRLHVPARV